MTNRGIQAESELIYNRIQKDKFNLRYLINIKEIELRSHTENKALAMSNEMMLFMKRSPWIIALLLMFTVISLWVNSLPVFAFGLISALSVGYIEKSSLQDIFALSASLIIVLYMIIF